MNKLNISIQMQRLCDWTKNQDLRHTAYKRQHLYPKTQVESEGKEDKCFVSSKHGSYVFACPFLFYLNLCSFSSDFLYGAALLQVTLSFQKQMFFRNVYLKILIKSYHSVVLKTCPRLTLCIRQ